MIGDMIKNIREYHDYSQIDIANFLQIKQPTYWLFENNLRIIPLKHLIKLADFYDVSIDYLLGLTNKNTNCEKNIEINKKLIGEKLLLFRKSFNVTQVKLAELLHTTHSTLSAYESGKTLILTAFAYQICKEYNISFDWLCGRSNNMCIQKNKKISN